MINKRQKLHVEKIGSGQPLVLLHGWGWHSGIWQPLIPHLAEKFQLFPIDLPGFGKSALGTMHYTIEEVTAEILAVAPHEAIWLGWSLGGMIAWHIAIHHPERVNKLITVASSPKFLSCEDWPGVAPHVLEKFSVLLLQDQQKTLHEFLELQLRGSENYFELLGQLKEIFSENEFSAEALQLSLKLLSDIDLRSQLASMSVPSVHVFGHHDTLVPVKITNKIASQLKFGKCEIIKRSGHLPFLSQVDSFLQLIK